MLARICAPSLHLLPHTCRRPLPASCSFLHRDRWAVGRHMATVGASTVAGSGPGPRAQAVTKLQEIISADPKGGWKRTWEQAVTPWDLGTVTPAVADLVAQGLLPEAGRVLVPGCGSGYDVVAMASPSRRAVGLDLSEIAVEKARKLAEGKEGAQYAEFVSGDFFTFKADPLFDAIFDHTFFVALEPSMRGEWASTMARLLAPSGQLITLIWPISDHTGGPPYAVTLSMYEEVLQPLGFEATVLKPLADSERWGKDMLVSWKRKAAAKI